MLISFPLWENKKESYTSTFFLHNIQMVETKRGQTAEKKNSMELELTTHQWLKIGCELVSSLTNAQGLRITEKKVLPLQLHPQSGTLKNPHTI